MMYARVILTLLFGYIRANEKPVILHIGGTFPMESGSGGWAGGEACLPAVQMALEDVNNRSEILPGYLLKLNNHDSKCQPGLAMQQLYDFLYQPPTKLMLLTGCSPVTTVIAEAAPVWKLVVLSYGGSSPALSNRERFPTLFRTHPSANMQNPTRIKLLEKFNWKKITILMSVEEVFVSTAKDLEKLARNRGIRVDRQSFYGDPTDAMKTLARQDARIIIGLFYVTEARKVLCQAYHAGLYGRRHVWFFIGWYADKWYIPPEEEGLNCTAEQMAEAAEYHFTTESIMLSRNNNPTISGMTGLQFQKRLSSYFEKDIMNVGGFPEAPLAYDAIWALALAFNCTKNSLPNGLKLEDFTYENTTISDVLFKCVQNIEFSGVSGKVKFSEAGDRIARTQIEQMQHGKYKVMGFYDTSTSELEWYNKEKWHSVKGPPTDSTVITKHVITVSNKVYYPTILFSLIGILCCFSIYFYIKNNLSKMIVSNSQYSVNNVLIFGCSLCLISLFLMGLPSDDISIPLNYYSFICHARLTILLFGFTLAYGSMFAKVWIVHRMGAAENQKLASRQKDEEENTPWEGIRALISTMVGRQTVIRQSSEQSYGALIEKRNLVLNQPIPPSKFYVIIFSLFLIDAVIVIIWILFDPLHLTEEKFPLQETNKQDEDEMIQPVLQKCSSNQQEVWIAIILGYKCLLLVFGLFLSYETRKLKIRFINDSRFIGLAIYNVSVVSLITVPVVTLFVNGEANGNFTFISLTVLICTYISLGLVFGPKIKQITKDPSPIYDTQRSQLISGSVLSTAEQKRYESLKSENDFLQRQIEDKKIKLHICRERLELICSNDGSLNLPLLNSYNEQINRSSPTLTSSTQLLEFQKTNQSDFITDDDHHSNYSDEILL